MIEMAEYGIPDVSTRLQNYDICAVASFTLDGKRVNSRHMSFACEPGLESFYLLTNKAAYKLREFHNNPSITLSVLGDKGSFDGYFQVTVFGAATILDRFDDPAVQNALARLSAKNRLAKALKEGGSLGDSVIVALRTEEIHFSTMREIAKGLPQTILKLQ